MAGAKASESQHQQSGSGRHANSRSGARSESDSESEALAIGGCYGQECWAIFRLQPELSAAQMGPHRRSCDLQADLELVQRFFFVIIYVQRKEALSLGYSWQDNISTLFSTQNLIGDSTILKKIEKYLKDFNPLKNIIKKIKTNQKKHTSIPEKITIDQIILLILYNVFKNLPLIIYKLLK